MKIKANFAREQPLSPVPIKYVPSLVEKAAYTLAGYQLSQGTDLRKGVSQLTKRPYHQVTPEYIAELRGNTSELRRLLAENNMAEIMHVMDFVRKSGDPNALSKQPYSRFTTENYKTEVANSRRTRNRVYTSRE